MKYFLKEDHQPEQLLELINEGIAKKAVIVIIACCKIYYEGRAKSRLGSGDRIIIIKSDGSFLIHQDRNLEPVNWQPPSTKFKARIEESKVYIVGKRRNPNESLELEIQKAYMASYFLLEDIKTLELAGYEEDMVDMIFKNPEIIEKGFRATSREYSTPEGFVDILGKDKNGTLVVLELKSRRAGLNAVRQLKRYINCFLDHKKFVRGILVAPSITKDALSLLKENKMEFKPLKPSNELKIDKNVTLDFFH